MIATSWALVSILAQSVWGGHGHGAAGPGCCDACGVETSAITERIIRMQKCPNWRARDDAAHALRKFDWRCHPEVAGALAYTLLHDGNEEVREEAAQSLTKMAPCLAVVHEALDRAATSDPDFCTRRRARKGLRALGGRCEGACKVCGPAIVVPVVPLPAGGGYAISGPTIVPGAVPLPAPENEPALTPAPAPGPANGPDVPPIAPPSAVPGETTPGPIDSRVEPPPTELSPLPPPPPSPEPRPPASANVDPVRTTDKDPEKTSNPAETGPARSRNRRLPFGLRFPAILSRR